MSWTTCMGAIASGNRRPRSSDAGIGGHGAHRQVARPVAQRADQRGLGVDPGHLVPGRGQVQGDPARAAAEVEHRPAGLRGQLAPQRQVRAVGAALGVVPGDRQAVGGHRAHSDHLRARPRRASAPRISSIAV